MLVSLYSLWIFLGLVAVYLVVRSVYRFYFDPLSHIPGPKLSILTDLYELYYDIVLGGRFLFQIEKWHEQYGPIVRINYREVHISDPEFYDEIYAGGAHKRDKDPKFVTGFALPMSMVATVGHDHHRFRRSILNNFFSKRSVLELSPMIDYHVQQLMHRLEEFHQDQTVIRLDDALAALTSDIITHYSYGRSWGYLTDKNFDSHVRNVVNDASTYVHINRFFPWFASLLRLVPAHVMCLIQPGKGVVFDMQKTIFKHSLEPSTEPLKHKGELERGNIFERLTDPSVPAEERTLPRLQDEGMTLLAAGTETTSRTITVAAYHLYREKGMVQRLRSELKTVLPTITSQATWTDLEKLPYLTGVVNESLRVALGLTIRLPRVAPTEVIQYRQYSIPPGTPVSTSSYFMHRSTSVFPEPEEFKPERWISNGEIDRHLTRYITSFTRGSRQCLGINLAYSELYMAIAYLVRRFDLELHDTPPENLRITRDMGVGFPDTYEFKVSAKVVGMVRE
ncbi:putative cytochrome P450 oxygenase [Aspergillus affinis]|uniref:putative cytochrome P450 oxygenase n=1 Tax=Aspergillus affinis TaxID=1070780 RepID=UPI0022FE9066|nr:cytochrome P450 [Aspergillus affinis]KAI9044814.1 cytochrome P450 [Aspergillus affinis]